MSRTALTLILLAAAGGCFSFKRDPDYENLRPMSPGQVRSTPSTWVTAAAPAAPGTPQARLSGYAPSDSRFAAGRTAAAALPSQPVPAEAEAAAPPSDDAINQSLVQATMVVAPRVTRAAEGPPPPPPSPPPPPPPPGPDLGSMPLPRIVNGKNPAPEWSPPTSAAPTSAAPTSAAPASPALRLVGSKRINFNFEVKDPATGVPVVELWGTQDLKNWKKYETVAHPPRTLSAEIKDEGLYGFSLLARSGASQDRPRTGDLPQVWVAVDYTRPVVQFLGAELNLTARVPTMVLRWSATDKNLGPRPVTLSFAEQPEGPWTPIAANLDNSGRYEWTLPAGIPAALHLRVQAADLMGNIGSAQTTTPLFLPRTASTLAPVVQIEKCDKAIPEPERQPPPPRLVTLPPTPISELPRPAPAEPARTQVNILSIEPERN